MSRINTNISALNSQRILRNTNKEFAGVVGRLSSGFRINKASDDAAGLGIANKLRSDVSSMKAAARNAEQANSMLQVMEGATSQISNILDRMKELATQANSASAGADAKTQLQAEFTALRSEMDRIANTTTFNGETLLTGGFGSAVDTDVGNSTVLTGQDVYGASLSGTSAGTYAVTDQTGSANQLQMSSGGVTETVTLGVNGAQEVTFSKFGITLNMSADFTRNTDGTAGNSNTAGDLVVTATTAGDFMVSSSASYAANDLVSVNAIDLTSDATGIAINAENISTASGAQGALSQLDTAIKTVNTKIGEIGVAQNRIDYAMKNVETTIENTAAAESVIRDADIAAEATELSRLQILQQAATSVLAQANQAPQGVLSLLR